MIKTILIIIISVSIFGLITFVIVRNMMKRNAHDAICAAAVRLFIPNHTLKIPRVNVSTAKYSTVPKSEIVSINTSAKPATIAGRAKGSATDQNIFRPETWATSK